MPHITLEYTDNIGKKGPFTALFTKLHDILVKEASVNIANCKSRAIKLSDYYIAQGDPKSAFVHLDLLLLAPKKEELVNSIGDHFLAIAQDFFLDTQAAPSMQISVAINQISKTSYFKSG